MPTQPKPSPNRNPGPDPKTKFKANSKPQSKSKSKSKPKSPSRTSAESEQTLLPDLERAAAQLRGSPDVTHILRQVVRFASRWFGDAEACFASRTQMDQRPLVEFSLPREASWAPDELAALLDRERTPPAEHQLFSRVKRRQRIWGVLCVRNERRSFQWRERRALSVIGNKLSELIEHADQQRIQQVRSRIDRKIMEQLRPQDLSYQILHGLKSLTRYDHSSTLLISDQNRGELTVAAEQIAWRKGKSSRVGAKIPLTPIARSLFGEQQAFAFTRDEELQWMEREGRGGVELADLLDFNYSSPLNPADPIEYSMICAPFVLRDGRLGALKIAAENPLLLDGYEARLVQEFVPHVVIALQNAHKTESLEQNVLAAERRSAMADLAKGVSHDINNALGTVLPLVQQMRQDLEQGHFDPAIFGDDLAEIEKALLLCRRVFGGMLRIAKGATPSLEEIVVAKEVEATLSVVGDSFKRTGIAVHTELDHLLSVQGVRADIQQLLLNILNNAREAMGNGGRMAIRVAARDQHVHLHISDTGPGIRADHLKQVCQPFFSTKKTGTGLGLAICYSIVSQMHGRLEIESEVDRGTHVHVMLPFATGSAP